jgi:hypothetical protein
MARDDSREPPRRLAEVFKEVGRHPIEYLVIRWNWKTAIGSEFIRGSIFFFTSLPDGLSTALTTLGRDALFRVPLGGAYGSLIQAFRNAEPRRAAMATVFLLMPAISHTIEFLVHWTGQTPRLGLAMLLSIALSGLSASFNLYAMRRGALVVDSAHSSSFLADLKRFPRLIVEFAVDTAKLLRGVAGRLRE